jgi:hypothetical protein
MSAVLAVAVVLGIGGVLSANDTVLWGTYTERDCEPKPRGGCRSIGVWISDDSSVRKEGIYLDGFTDTDGTVRAAYRPSGFNNDDENNIVHVETFAFAWIWAPWVLAATISGVIVYYLRKWRLLPRRPRTSAATRGALDSEH